MCIDELQYEKYRCGQKMGQVQEEIFQADAGVLLKVVGDSRVCQ
jgi:hypothetical protein